MHTPLTRLAVRLAPPQPDGALLARFSRDRDETAFAALVHRHGPTVYGVCRRVLGNSADADDAFQAVFLVLVNRADALAGRPALGDWLHGVAVRVALKARTTFARLRKHERRAAERRTESVLDAPLTEPSAWLDRELAALPERLRRPVVACLLEERSRSEVAAELGIPEGTLASRLDAARKRLAERLARHRVPLAFVGLLVPVPAGLAATTVNRATDGTGAAIHQLANEVTRTMATNKNWALVIVAVALTAAAGGWLLASGPPPKTAPAPRPLAAAPQDPPVPEWEEAFHKKYRLADGEYVKRVAPPYIRERIDFQYHSLMRGRKIDLRGYKSYREQAEKLEMFMTAFVEQDGIVLRMRYSLSSAYLMDFPPDQRQGDNLLTVWDVVTYVTGLKQPEVMIDPAAKDHPLFAPKNKTVHGDFVTRKEAPLEKLAPQLEKILRDECKADVRLTLKEEEQQVYVVSGVFEPKPPAWRPKGHLDVYATEDVLDKDYDHFDFEKGRKDRRVKSSQSGGSPVDFVRSVGNRIRTRMVFDAPLPTEPKLSWIYHVTRDPTPAEDAADRDPEKVLKVVAAQTGLTFKKDKRKVTVLYVGAPPPKK